MIVSLLKPEALDEESDEKSQCDQCQDQCGPEIVRLLLFGHVLEKADSRPPSPLLDEAIT